MGGKCVNNTFQLTRFFHNTHQISADNFFAITQPQQSTFNTLFDQVFIQRRLVFKINFRAPAAHLKQGRLRDIKIATFNQFWHLAEKERQQERADMRTIDVSVCHDHNFMIAQLFDIEFIATNACAQRHDQIANFLAA